MLLSHFDTTSLTKVGDKLSVELDTSHFHAGSCNSFAKVMSRRVVCILNH